jgi:hypothetical protein
MICNQHVSIAHIAIIAHIVLYNQIQAQRHTLRHTLRHTCAAQRHAVECNTTHFNSSQHNFSVKDHTFS